MESIKILIESMTGATKLKADLVLCSGVIRLDNGEISHVTHEKFKGCKILELKEEIRPVKAEKAKPKKSKMD